MPILNRAIVETFEEIADLLELKDANPFRIRAYRDAARTLGTLPTGVEEMLENEEDLTELPGIGKDLSGKIETLVKTGSLPQLEKLRDEVSPGLLEVMNVPHLGPERTRRLADHLGIESLDDLEQAIDAGWVEELEGFGKKSASNIRQGIERLRERPERFRWAEAEEIIAPLVAYLREVDGVGECVVAGSYRRRQQTVGDIDILITSNANRRVMDSFVAYEDVDELISQGSTRSSVRLRGGLQVDLRVVAKKSYGAALLYFTGSKAHNIKLRKMAQSKGWQISEYGLFEGHNTKAGRTESGIYEALGLTFIPPEVREEHGEVEAAEKESFPRLITLDDIRGDLHVHTEASDSEETLEKMVQAAAGRGYDYIAITDHSAHVGITRGLDAEALEKQVRNIRSRDESADGLKVLAGVEVDIDGEGQLALPDSILAELDVVIASVHTRFGLPRSAQTKRIRKAMANRHVHILGHPTGRLLGKRDGYAVDLEELISAAAEEGWAFELNANPLRLDLDDIHCKRARQNGVKVAISTDAHRAADLSDMSYGIGQGRRGWLSSDDVLNTRPCEELASLLRRGDA